MILSDLIKIGNLSTKKEKAYFLDNLGKVHAELLNIIFDKDVRFYTDVNKVQKGVSTIAPFLTKQDEELNIELLDLLKILASEELRGNEAIAKCIDFADQLNCQECEMFYNILENKTRLGIGATDINKLCKTFKIQQFEVMFAVRYDKVKKLNWNRNWCIQPKIDGNRCIFMNGKFYSRTGKEFTSLDKFKNILNKFPNIVFDGEIEQDGSLEATGAIRRKDEQAHNAIYTIFGCYPLNEWDSKQFTQKYQDVLALLKQLISDDNSAIRTIPTYYITPQSEQEFDTLIQQYSDEFIKQGYEGAVLKTLDHYYTPSTGTKRSDNWIKIKPSKDSEGIVTEIFEGEGEWKNSVGRFKIKWLDKEFEVAPGKFTQAQRNHIWINAESYIGKKLEFQYQCLSEYGIPRHAFALRFRESD